MHHGKERRQIRLLIRAILTLIILIGAFVAWIIFQPPPVRPKITLHLSGYTNDFAGNRLAIFTITNNTSAQILAYMPRILTKDDTQPNGFSQTPKPVAAWQAKLKFGESAILRIRTDTNTVPWKLELYVYNDLDLGHTLKNIMTFRRQMPFSIKSDWYEPETLH